MDLFIEYPELHAKSMAVHATTESVWRLDRITGPTGALAAFDETLSSVTDCDQRVGMCGAPVVEWDYEILASSADGRIVYSRRTEGTGVQSIPHIAAEHIGDGLLMQAERRGPEYQWRLLVDDDDTVGAIYEEVEAGLCEELTVSVERLSEPKCWFEETIGDGELPPEQHAALEAAVEFGYYESPRRNTVSEIAEHIDVPRSTLQYRLTRAEAWLARQFVSDSVGVAAEEEVESTALETGV
jgi:hypothetical protein